MSWPYLHTIVNHFPIVLTVIGALAVLLSAMFQRRAVWMYALATLTLAGVTIYPAWVTGGRAAGAVRNAWYIERGTVHAHSAAAGVTLWTVGITGLLALIALITMIRTSAAVSPARILRVLVGLGAALSICAVCYTGYLGGEIVLASPILASPTPPVITVPLPGTRPAQPLPGSTSPTDTLPSTTPGQRTQPQQQLQTQPQTQPQSQSQPPVQPQPQPQTQPQTQPQPAAAPSRHP